MTIFIFRQETVMENSSTFAGQMRTLSFEERHHPKFGPQWVNVESVLLQGTTTFIVDSASQQPSANKPKWQVKVNRVIHKPDTKDPNLYYDIAYVILVAEVAGTKCVSVSKPTTGHKGAVSVSEKLADKPITPNVRILRSICLLKTTGTGHWTFSFPREDGVIEIFVAEGGQSAGGHKAPDGTIFSNPIDLEVVRVIEDLPRLKKYLVRPVRKIPLAQAS